MDWKSEINEINSNLIEMNKLYSKSVQAAIIDIVNIFFKANPDANTVFWTQSTPLWNDGDPCVFSIDEVFASCEKISKLKEGNFTVCDGVYEEYVEDLSFEEAETKRFDELGDKTVDECEKIDINFDTDPIHEFLNSHDQVFDNLYGNSVVYISRDGKIERNDYNIGY